MQHKLSNTKGFTLIELIIVLVLIGILAAVAVPRFANLQDQAIDAAVEGTLGNVRSGITIFRAEQLATDPSSSGWPTHAQLTTVGTVMMEALPDMEKHGTTVTNAVVDQTAAATTERLVTAAAGWAYDPDDGRFWANTSEDTANEW